MGSVKDLIITRKATRDRCGTGRFTFSDRYSVFDWGEMPDLIPNKGEALTLMTAFFFERLEEAGIPTHYRGVVSEGGVVPLAKLAHPERALEVRLVRVVRPALRRDHTYDYSQFREETGNRLIPLEIIYRNFLPEGSSFVKRVQNGSILLKDYGLDQIPHPEDRLPKPIFDYSTKLEPTDRYLTPAEALDISGLSASAFQRAQEILQQVNLLINRILTPLGLVNVDGKIELGVGDKDELMVVDALGTPDECRFYFQGFHVSKEVARIYYRGTDWYHAVEAAKREDRERWKERVSAPPPPLPPGLKNLISAMYRSLANAVTGRIWFPETPPIEDVVRSLKEAAF
jgi:phosphoribosylaminoimidazole-succinocarboxamide synthase